MMKIIKFILKLIIVASLVVICVPAIFTFSVLISFMIELEEEDKNNHSLEEYSEYLNVNIPDGTYLESYVYAYNYEVCYYIVYEMNDKVSEEDFIKENFVHSSDYDLQIDTKVSKINEKKQISNSYMLDLDNQNYTLCISPDEWNKYYFIYDSQDNLLFLLYSMNSN